MSRLSLRMLFFTVICLAAPQVNAADLGLPDVTQTATPEQIAEMKRFVDKLRRGHVSLDKIPQKNELVSHFTGATDDESEAASLGREFVAYKQKLQAEKERDDAKRKLRNATIMPKAITGVLALFIVVDKIIFPLAKKCRKRFQKKRSPEKFSFGERLVAVLKEQKSA